MVNAEGRILLGRYNLLSPLGAGGQGSVWKADDLMLEREVALKELLEHNNGLDLPERRTRVIREARAMARVKHPAIVKIYDVFLDDQEDPWIVMEYIRGRSLESRIKDKPLDEAAVAAIGLPVLEGLRAAHRADVMHRDVKPANILVADDNSVYLVDFGIAKIAGDVALTGQSKILGTIEFMAPERLLGRQVTAASDLWSLGVTFFCALEGYSPFVPRGSRNVESVMGSILSNDPPPLSRPGPLADIVVRLLDKIPANRPSGAALERVLKTVAGGTSPAWEFGGRPTETAARAGQVPRKAGTAGNAGTAKYAGPARNAGRSTVLVNDGGRGQARTANVGAQAAKILGMSQENAAHHLADCPPRVAAEILELIAGNDPAAAAAIIQMISLKGASRTVGHLTADSAAVILATMPTGAVAPILNLADARAAGGILMALDPGMAARVLGVMDESQAAVVLGYVEPATAAVLLESLGEPRRSKLLTRVNASVRSQVIRHLRARKP